MKLFVIILSIYSIALTTLPCDDEFVDDKQHELSISQSLDDINHNTFDLCSPFCSCVCCASFFNETSVYQEVLQTKIAVKKLCIFRNTSFSNNYFFEIYQPPKV